MLGFTPLKKRALQLLLGFGFIFLLRSILILIETSLLSIEWEINTELELIDIVSSLWFHTKSALTEDLIFRGAGLYLLASKFSNKTALLVSAILFGIYHWFSYGMFGSGLIPMLYIFIITGATGAVWAYSYFKTNSIFLALGFHIAWNFTTSLFFEGQPFGELLFHQSSSIPISEWGNFFLQFAKGLFPSLFTYLFIKYIYTKKRLI